MERERPTLIWNSRFEYNGIVYLETAENMNYYDIQPRTVLIYYVEIFIYPSLKIQLFRILCGLIAFETSRFNISLLFQDNNTGQSVLDVAFRHLNLLETAYFGLRFLDPEGQTHWLDPAKKLSRQLKGPDPYTLYFGVKFYAADPCKLLEEITRYQFFLQVKQDILQGRLPVTFDLAAELGAYIIQSELGDYDPRRHSPGYVSEFRFLSNQTLELESRIAELHKTLVGQLPSVAELNYLDKVKWLDMYGVDLHPVLGEDNVEYFLGLTPSGIIVLRNKNTVGNYYWPRISKIYFKGRYFMLRVTDKNNDENTYGFETPSKAACKHLWKCCVEHHAFFRLVQVSPTTPDIFALGSRFRYSGRTEKQAVRDAQLKVRTPPPFSRTPSRRYQRRIVEGANDTSQAEETVKIDHYQSSEIKHVSIPQPAQSFDSPYRATCNTSTTDVRHRSDSPRSTRSAPWSQPHSRGLYNSSVPPSPRSVRSAGPRYRSSSVDSQSSNDSRSCKSRRKHRSRMTSDNESELSKGSNRSHRKHRRHRSRGNRRDSGSEQESTSHRRKSRSRRSDSHYELVDSGSQWREVQRKHSAEGALTQQSTLISNKRSGYTNSGMESESELSYRKHRRQRKHRSRSRSPDSKVWLPDELKKHLEFNLIDTSGMSESQLREIPYTVVQTNNAKQMKIKHLQWGKGDGSSPNEKRTESPPPPYSPQISEANRVRMRVNHSSLKAHSPSGNADLISMTTSSIASNSSTQSNPNMLPRMLDSLSIADNYSFNGSQRSGKSSRVGSSALYGNPNTLLGGLSNGYQDSDSTRVSHEHTDSGLGGEQDLAYSSERSSDSTKQGQGTNKGNCGESRIGLIPVSKSFTSDYQPLNPQQLYPSHSGNMAGSRAKQALNAGKSSVYKQEADSRYGQFKPSRITYNAYNASNNAATTHLEGVSHKQQADARPIFIRTGSKTSNASSNSHLTDHNNSSLRGSLRSIASNPVTNGNETGPLRVQYRMGSSLRSKCSVISDTKSEFDDNYIYSSHITDTNQNINEFSRCQSRSTRSTHNSAKPPLPPISNRSRSASLEYVLTPLIRSSQHRSRPQ
ncbi:FERM N-terminal domain [Popillia japonica]|uniref:FERM N-terminal domain n=1 Tax=Popillia japonica TaxID=7064 RepID=A0AAW1NA44_POPJA